MKILIISSTRTGSSYFARTIYRYFYRNTLFLKEPFMSEKLSVVQSPDKYVRGIIKSCLFENVILKTHLNQLYNINRTKNINFFLNNDIWYKIFLLRKDLFKTTFSHVVANKLQNFNDFPYEKTTISIDEDKFTEALETKIDLWTKFAELKKNNIHNDIIYFEDLSFDSYTDYKKLNLPFDNSPPRPTFEPGKTPYKIINVLNKDKLQEIFNERMFNFSSEGIKNINGMLELE